LATVLAYPDLNVGCLFGCVVLASSRRVDAHHVLQVSRVLVCQYAIRSAQLPAGFIAGAGVIDSKLGWECKWRFGGLSNSTLSLRPYVHRSTAFSSPPPARVRSGACGASHKSDAIECAICYAGYDSSVPRYPCRYASILPALQSHQGP
jgi:hypothetical protein